MAEKQRVRWADMEEGQTGEKEEEVDSRDQGQAEVSEMEAERLRGQGMAAEEDRPEVGRDEKRKEEKQETAEEREQLDEEALAADQGEFHRENDRDCVETEEGGQFRWEEWEWESTVDEVGSARGAFELRVREDVRRHDDGQDKGGRRREVMEMRVGQDRKRGKALTRAENR